MKCRALVQNESTEKQNIVWFGSYGKNKNFILKQFTEAPSEEEWSKNYSNYYTISYIRQNQSNVWGENQILPDDNLVPGDDLMLIPKNTYYREYNGSYYTITSEPKDWEEKWQEYWVISFAQNQSRVFDPNKVYYAHNNKLTAENYSEEQKGVRDSLVQRLSIIKGELWYKASYGLPLTEKVKNKGIYDSIIISIITSHPDVVNISYYNSVVENKTYYLDFIVYTIYNQELRVKTILGI